MHIGTPQVMINVKSCWPAAPPCRASLWRNDPLRYVCCASKHIELGLWLCRGKKVMMDCGIHPGLQGEDSLPFLTNEDLDTVNVALITHFHLDHCAAVPYLLSRTTFNVGGCVGRQSSNMHATTGSCLVATEATAVPR